MGDPILANAIWIHQDPSANRALGITQYLFLPLGDYSKNKELNIGENRWKYVLQGGTCTHRQQRHSGFRR
jgi:hypothetical protein